MASNLLQLLRRYLKKRNSNSIKNIKFELQGRFKEKLSILLLEDSDNSLLMTNYSILNIDLFLIFYRGTYDWN